MVKNRRNLKKFVNCITSELFAETFAIQYYNQEVDRTQLNEVFGRIIKLQNEYLSRVSHTEPGNAQMYYKKFKNDFNVEVDEIVNQLNALG